MTGAPNTIDDRSVPDDRLCATPEDDRPSVPEIESALARIVDDADFDASPRNREFLRFVVSETLSGRGERIKAYAIAVEVFHRDGDFDPQADPIVRIEAGRLRRSLERYYMLGGRDDTIRIDIPKGGYVPVFSRPEGSAAALADGGQHDETAPEADDAGKAVRRPGPGTHRWPWRHAVTFAAGVALAAGLLFLFVGAPGQSQIRLQEARTVPAAAAPPTIMVLPFQAESGDEAEIVFAQGLTEEVHVNLMRFGEIRVLEATAAGGDPMTLAADLDADYLLRGSVTRHDSSIAIRMRLIGVESAAGLWGDSFVVPYDVESLLSVIDETASSIASTIAQPYGIVFHDHQRMVLSAGETPLSGFLCLVLAYDYRARISADGNHAAFACLNRATVLESQNAEAWAMLALVDLDVSRFRFPVPEGLAGEPLAAAASAAQQAVAVNPFSALAQHALSEVRFFEGDLPAALEAGERAVALNPNNADYLAMLGLRLVITGSLDRGMRLVDQAMVLNPAPPGWYHFAPALFHLAHDDPSRALASALHINMPAFYLDRLLLASLHGLLGHDAVASALLAEVDTLYPTFFDCPRSDLAFRNIDPALIDRLLRGFEAAGRRLPDTEAPCAI
ncbi:MAG: hypothetical protein RLO50_02570 [Azospirillaceae bacterium]